MTNQINKEQYTAADRLASVGRRLYRLRYRDVRRPDGTRLWKTANALSSVIRVALQENSIPHYAEKRAKYVKEEDVIPFLEEYITTRINSNGTTRSTLDQIGTEKPPVVVKFGFISRLLGMPALVVQLRTMTDLLARIYEQLEELNDAWKPKDSVRDDAKSR
tara:strand:+ start:799 stop:1284 length:486 start_codon:yes stop_codon:yes gene_type:complete